MKQKLIYYVLILVFEYYFHVYIFFFMTSGYLCIGVVCLTAGWAVGRRWWWFGRSWGVSWVGIVTVMETSHLVVEWKYLCKLTG